MSETQHPPREYCMTLPEAIKKAKQADYTNGMATKQFMIQCENCHLSVMRKSGSLDHPEILRFEISPLSGDSFDLLTRIEARQTNAKHIKECLDHLYGDIEVQFGDDNIAVVGLP